jgi:hypothetical protein
MPRQAITGGSAIVEDVEEHPVGDKSKDLRAVVSLDVV